MNLWSLVLLWIGVMALALMQTQWVRAAQAWWLSGGLMFIGIASLLTAFGMIIL